MADAGLEPVVTAAVVWNSYHTANHRRMLKKEEKAKVVAAVWGDRIDSIHCRASYFASE